MTKHTPDFSYLRGLKPLVFSVEDCANTANSRRDKDTRIAELEAELAAEREKVERLREALTNIHDYGIDRDGETTAEKLGELVDELVQIAREALAVTTQRRPNG